MSLNTGDILEGVYQLEEKVFVGAQGQASRWLADDITAYRRSEVVVDIIPADYVTGLHWKADRLDMRSVGQSADCNCRYMVWEKDKALPPAEKYEVLSLDDKTRARLAGLIDTLPVAPHEALVAQVMPEYWRCGTDGIMVFYCKSTSKVPPGQSVQAVKEHWKQALFNAGPLNSPDISERKPDKSTSLYWTIALSVIGLLLAVGVYSLRSQPNLNTEQPRSATRLLAFTDAFERGIAYERIAAYQDAVRSFETAVREAPASEMIDTRLDSLARAYAAYAQAECTRYHTTGSAQLYFIPNQYYHYAAILSRNHTIKTCK